MIDPEILRFIGLIELSTPLALNGKIQAAKLPTECQLPHLGYEQVIALGNGRTQIDDYPPDHQWDPRVRQAEFTTMSSDVCADERDVEKDVDSVICIDEDRENSRSTFKGDSGMAPNA